MVQMNRHACSDEQAA